jgi:hypothetical protein
MPDPIIFDDGGSTRIRRLQTDGNGAMDNLMNPDPGARPPQSQAETINGPFSHIKVLSIDQTGAVNTPIAVRLTSGDNFTISSENDQSVSVKIGDGSNCTVKVIGSVGDAHDMESKEEFNGKRRYLVNNAGRIQQVTATIKGTSQSYDVPANTVYTMVLLT